MFIRKEQVEVNSSDDLMQSLYNLLSFDNDCNGTNSRSYRGKLFDNGDDGW